MHERPGLGITIALGAAVFYGLVPILVRGAFLNGVPAVDTVVFRTIVITLVLGTLALLRREAMGVPPPARRAFAAQLLATLIVSVGYLASVQFIPVGLAVIIFYTFPVLIMLASPLAEGHAPGLLRVAIAAFAFAGLAVSIGPSFEELDPRGIALATAAAIGCTLQFFSGRALGRHMMPASFGSLIHLALLPFVVLIAVWAGGGAMASLAVPAAPGGFLFATVTAAVYVGGYFCHMLSLRFAQASTVAPFYNIEPVIATVVAALVLGERLTPGQYVGGGMVMAALVASGLLGRRKDA